ncbi:hypothetical protein [Thalassoglobus neptunius]|uniref:hypothetical protein n=1 Tax=Thalassoglobus neptunius TaxID=1938619 RepID=UPI0011B5E289|nr:hypothetical protein [Thalassoglobus neptunius]
MTEWKHQGTARRQVLGSLQQHCRLSLLGHFRVLEGQHQTEPLSESSDRQHVQVISWMNAPVGNE